MFDMGTESALTGRSTATLRYSALETQEERDMHVVDATLFYSPTSGGVKRYLLAKHDWMRAHTNWRHSLVVPGETNRTHPATSRRSRAGWCRAHSTTGCR
jgi:hypothetical protein